MAIGVGVVLAGAAIAIVGVGIAIHQPAVTRIGVLLIIASIAVFSFEVAAIEATNAVELAVVHPVLRPDGLRLGHPSAQELRDTGRLTSPVIAARRPEMKMSARTRNSPGRSAWTVPSRLPRRRRAAQHRRSR